MLAGHRIRAPRVDESANAAHSIRYRQSLRPGFTSEAYWYRPKAGTKKELTKRQGRAPVDQKYDVGAQFLAVVTANLDQVRVRIANVDGRHRAFGADASDRP